MIKKIISDEKYIENNIETHVNNYLEDNPEDCGYRYIFNESSLIEFVTKMIELAESRKEHVRKEFANMFDKIKGDEINE